MAGQTLWNLPVVRLLLPQTSIWPWSEEIGYTYNTCGEEYGRTGGNGRTGVLGGRGELPVVVARTRGIRASDLYRGQSIV